MKGGVRRKLSKLSAAVSSKRCCFCWVFLWVAKPLRDLQERLGPAGGLLEPLCPERGDHRGGVGRRAGLCLGILIGIG